MAATLPLYGYLFLALVGLVVLILGGTLIIAVVDAIRIAYTKHPSRFRRAERLASFRRERLPAIAEDLDMQLHEHVPAQLQKAIENTVGNLGSGGVEDVLTKSSGEGALYLCNIQKSLLRRRTSQDGSSPIEWTKIEEYTCLVFIGGDKKEYPKFNLTPNERSLIITLFNKRLFGTVQFDDPEFHQHILIGTTEPDEVRPLLMPHVRDVLKKNADLRTAVCGPYVVVYDYGNIGKGIRFANLGDGRAIVDCEVISDECWRQFYKSALEVIESLRAAQFQLLDPSS